MKLIHCSDIHLDSRMETNLSAAKARQRNTEICRTFERMITYARHNDVKAILIVGDLFDAQRTRNTTIQFILHVIETAPNIDFLYLRGNHDQKNLTVNGPLPRNLKLFHDSWTQFRYDDVVISGLELSLTNYANMYDTLNLQTGDKNIVILHGQTASTPGRELIALPRLAGKNIDYLALGHLHSYQTASIDHRGTYCYSGCLEGRGFDECGEKGFVLLETTAHGIRHEFVPFAQRRIHSIDVDISQCESSADILSAIRRSTSQIPGNDMVRIVLVGTYPAQMQKDLPFLENMLDPAFYSVKIADESQMQLPKKEIEKEVSLKSEFIRSVLQDKSLSETEVEDILQFGLAALRGEELDT